MSPTPGKAATININSPTSGAVCGNSSNPDGSLYDLTPSNNTLNLNNGADTGNHGASGAYSTASGVSVTGNKVNVFAGSTAAMVHGGYNLSNGNVTGNEVTVSGGNITQSIWGGWSNGGDVVNNRVLISGGTFNTANSDIYAGQANGSGNATGNTVTIESAVTGIHALVGGVVTGTGTSSGNTLELKTSGLSISGDLGWFQNLNFYLPSTLTNGDTMLAAAGTATINGATVNVNLDGGTTGLNLGNTVTLISGTLSGTLANTTTATTVGGVTYGYALNNTGTALNLFHNSVSTSGDWTAPAGYTAQAGANAGENVSLSVGGVLTAPTSLTMTSSAASTATLTAGTLKTPSLTLDNNAGGGVTATIGTLDAATGNTALTLDGTTAAGVNIGNVALAGGNTFTVTSVNSGGATFNALDLTAGSGELKLDSTSATDVIINAVNLSGSNTFTVTSANSGTGTFTNLNVTGTGGTVTAPATQLFSNVNLAGGSTLAASALNFSTMRIQDRSATYNGNLNAAGKSLIFELPASLTPGQTMLDVTGSADLTGTNIGMVYQTVRPTIAEGERLTLLEAAGGVNGFTTLTVQTANGDVYTLSVSANQLLAMLDKISPDTPAYERLKAYAEGRTATLAFVNQGADLILNQGMGSALMSTRGPGFQFNAFAAGQGGWSRYNTGSHVDVSGASMLAGLAIGNDAGPGRITAGLFFEGGWGNYNSYNSFSNYASVDGDGDTNYYGGGILGRYDVTGGALSGLYFDASARMGRASTDFGSSDIKYNGSKADFDSDSMYWGAHAGLGYQWSFTEKAMLDLSGKFIWTRQDGDSVNVHGDRVRFDSADSLRTRLGGRFNYAVCDYATPYVGAYWEHEFDGKQRSTINGVGTGSPDLKGDTGMGELGLTIKPVKDSGFSMDLGVQGYTGVREGVTGSLQLKFEF